MKVLKKKRGISSIIINLAITLFIILMFFIIANITFSLVKKQSKKIEIQNQIKDVKIKVLDFSINPSYINVTLKRSADEFLSNFSIVYHAVVSEQLSAQVISVVDLSGSMSGQLDNLKNSNKNFVSGILKQNTIHYIGFVGYASSVKTEYNLSRNESEINNYIGNWTAGGYTCISCGIARAIEILNNSKKGNFSVIVLMSDGRANRNTTGGSLFAEEEAINLSEKAYKQYNITIYSIGFGVGADEETLKKIANVSGGEYSYSSKANLSSVYKKVQEKIIEKTKTNYATIKGKVYLRFVFFNKTKSFAYTSPNALNPLQSKRYIIPLEKDLGSYIMNVNSVEIYLVYRDKSNNEYVSPLLDRIKIQ